MKILVVDPDRDLSITMIEWFENEGYQCSAVHTTQEAVDQLDQNQYDLIILELMISGSNGAEFLQEIRSYSDWRDIPCIIYTRTGLKKSYLSKEVRDNLGITDVFYKSRDSLGDITSCIKRLES